MCTFLSLHACFFSSSRQSIDAVLLAGADDFLPVLIYVLIHANPPQLASNLEYIQRFRMHSRMVSESAYFFTQLVRPDQVIMQPLLLSCMS